MIDSAGLLGAIAVHAQLHVVALTVASSVCKSIYSMYLLANVPGHNRHKCFVCRQVLAQDSSKSVRVVLCIVYIPHKLVMKSLGPQTDVQPAFPGAVIASLRTWVQGACKLPYDLVAFSLRFVTRGRTAFLNSTDLLPDYRHDCGYGCLRQVVVTA